MDFNRQIEKLQKQPYETKTRILWSVVAVCAVILVIAWIANLKNTFKNTTPQALVSTNTNSGLAAAETDTPFVSVERVEQTSGAFKIYFNINNQTNDILNISKLTDITLIVDNNSIHPTEMSDRQGQAFIQKALSHTQTFGILTFTNVSGNKAQLIFDQMFFENTPTNLLKQTMDLDLNKLNQGATIRN